MITALFWGDIHLLTKKQTFTFSADRGAEGNRGTSIPG